MLPLLAQPITRSSPGAGSPSSSASSSSSSLVPEEQEEGEEGEDYAEDTAKLVRLRRRVAALRGCRMIAVWPADDEDRVSGR